MYEGIENISFISIKINDYIINIVVRMFKWYIKWWNMLFCKCFEIRFSVGKEWNKLDENY